MVRRTAGLFALALAAMALSGCNEEEQARPIRTEKGAYQGAADTALAPQQVQALQQRSTNQRF